MEEEDKEVIIYGLDNLTEDYLYIFLNNISDLNLYNHVKINSIPLEIDNFTKSIEKMELLLKDILKLVDNYNYDIEINYSTQNITIRRAFTIDNKEYEFLILDITLEKDSNTNKYYYVVQAGLNNTYKYTAQIKTLNLYKAIEISINSLIDYVEQRKQRYITILEKSKNIRMNKQIFTMNLRKFEIIEASLKNILGYIKANYEKNAKNNNNNNIMEKIINEIKRDIEQ